MEDLRRGWDLHVEFGLGSPTFYTLMYGDPRPGATPTAALEAAGILHSLVLRVAEAGRLRVGVEHAAGVGVVLTLLGTEPEDRDLALSETTREVVLAAVTTNGNDDEAATERTGHSRVATRAVALKAVLPEAAAELSPGEQIVLSEWLDKRSSPPANLRRGSGGVPSSRSGSSWSGLVRTILISE